MLRKSARFVLALMLSLALCPVVAFAVEGDGGVDEPSSMAAQANGAPAITGVSVRRDANTVTVSGQNFGATQGTGTAQVYTGGVAGGEPIETAVSSWSDAQISLKVGKKPSGIIDVVITTEGGAVHKNHFVNPGPDVFENSLERPDDLFESSYNGPLGSSSILKGWGEYLYYLRQAPVSAGSSEFAFTTFERYGVVTGEWEELESLPEPLVYATGCVWEGNFLVSGVAYDVASGTPSGGECIYLFNFDRGTWVALDADDVPLGAGIVNLNGFLMLVGGADSDWSFVDDVYDYDTGAGIGDRVASLEIPAFCPQLAVNDGNIFVYSYGDDFDEFNGAGAESHLQVVTDDDAMELEDVFPDFVPSDVPLGMPSRSEEFGSLAAAIEGLMLVGPTSADGATDTYILDWDYDDATFLPYYKRASDARLFGAAACIHDNQLYAAAASAVEPSHSVFRSTEMITPTVEKGNHQVWRQGSNKELSIVFTPDYSRYYDRLYVDGVELYGDTEYNVSMGSTVIDLMPSYLSTLALGEHEMLVYFDGYEDGPGAEVLAYFTIEPAKAGPGGGGDDSPAPIVPGHQSGYKRPAALAMTGDMMLVVPFAVLGIGAIAIGVYLVRRRICNR